MSGREKLLLKVHFPHLIPCVKYAGWLWKKNQEKTESEAGCGMEVKLNLCDGKWRDCTGSGVDTSRISLEESLLACDAGMPSLRLPPPFTRAGPDSDDVVIGKDKGDLGGC